MPVVRLGLDLYLWLTYRTFGLKSSLRLSWKQLYRQFGLHPDKASDNRTVDAFRTKCLRELKKIKMSWPDLKYSTAKGVLILHPSKPAIAPAEAEGVSELRFASRRGISTISGGGY